MHWILSVGFKVAAFIGPPVATLHFYKLVVTMNCFQTLLSTLLWQFDQSVVEERWPPVTWRSVEASPIIRGLQIPPKAAYWLLNECHYLHKVALPNVGRPHLLLKKSLLWSSGPLHPKWRLRRHRVCDLKVRDTDRRPGLIWSRHRWAIWALSP